MQEIIHINYQRTLRTSAVGATEYLASTLRILRRIQSFSVESWVKEVRDCLESTRESKDGNLYEESTWKWWQIGSAYHEAVTLYCISSLVDHDGFLKAAATDTKLASDLQDILVLRQACHQLLLNDLRDVAKEPTTHLRKLTLWPLFIAGIESREETARSFILSEIAWLAKAIGTASALEAKYFLQRRWRDQGLMLRQTMRPGQDWGSLFDRPYIFAF